MFRFGIGSGSGIGFGSAAAASMLLVSSRRHTLSFPAHRNPKDDARPEAVNGS